jgi:hypothetical protein
MQTILNSSLFIQHGVRAQRKSVPTEVLYVTFENEDGSTISITPKWTQSDVELQYSFDASSWSDATSETEIENTSGNKIYMRGKAPTSKTLYTGDTSSNAWVTDATKITGNLNFLLCDDLGDEEAPVALDDYAYTSMFFGCTSLVTAPELPATTLAIYCYASMFRGCTSLVTAPELPATTLATSCYNAMFFGCTSLVTAPELPATTLATNCYYAMFYNCTSLTSIKMYYTGTTTSFTSYWVFDITTTGTLYKAGTQYSASGNSTYPPTWTQTAI